MDENEINTLYAHIRNEKIKLLENRKRKVSKNGTSSSGSIGKKDQNQMMMIQFRLFHLVAMIPRTMIGVVIAKMLVISQ